MSYSNCVLGSQSGYPRACLAIWCGHYDEWWIADTPYTSEDEAVRQRGKICGEFPSSTLVSFGVVVNN